MADGVWKGVYPLDFGRSHQLLRNKFLIRALLLWEKVATEEKKTGKNNQGKKKIKTFLVVTNVIANRPPEC